MKYVFSCMLWFFKSMISPIKYVLLLKKDSNKDSIKVYIWIVALGIQALQ